MGFRFWKYIPIIAACAKGLLHLKHDFKVKTFDQTKEKIDTIEHMMIKLEKKINDCRNDIEDLRRQVVFSRLLNLIMGMLIVILVIFLR